MSQVNYRDSFSDSAVDERLYTSSIETLSLSRSPVQSVEFPPFMGGPGYSHQAWSNEHLPTPGPYSVVNHPNYPPQAAYTSTTGHDNLPHTITQLTEHTENQTNHDNHYGPIVPGPLQLEYNAAVAPEVPSDGPLGSAPIPDNVAGPSGDNSGPVHPGISDDEDLKRLAKRYLDDHGAHVDKLLVERRFPSGRRVLILLEIDDAV